MKQQFKTEWERMITGHMFTIALLVGVIIVLMQIIMEVYPASETVLSTYSGVHGEPKSLYTYWIGMNGISPYREVYVILLPILAMMPHALSYHSDIKSGYVKSVYTRTRKINYLSAKYIVTFLSGGIVVVLPYILNYIISACMLPAFTPIRNGQFFSSAELFQGIFYTRPVLYTIIRFVIMFVLAGAFAVTVLAATCVVENIFLLSMVSFIIWYGLLFLNRCFMLKNIYLKIDPTRYVLMYDSYFEIHNIILLPLMVGGLSALIYYLNGVKSDAL